MVKERLLPYLLLCVMCLQFFHLFYKIEFFPQAGGDEQDMLSIDHRFVAYGERRELVIISENYNHRQLQKIPFPWTGWLRSLFHWAFGCSSFLGRAFSSFLVINCVFITAVLCPLRTNMRWIFLLLLFFMAAFSPSLYFAARTVRLEQEILFWGIISLFLLPLLLKKDNPSLSKLIWLCSGALSGWAAISHPGGVTFLVVQFLGLFLFSRDWSEMDGLTSIQRLLRWALGITVPLIIMAGILFSDWTNWASFFYDMNQRFIFVKERLVNFWAPQWSYRIGSSPPILAASLQAFWLTAVTPWIEYPGTKILALVFFIQVGFLVCASILLLLSPSRINWPLHLKQMIFLSSGFTFLHFLYAFRASPNYTYYPYLGLTVPLSFSWLSIVLFKNSISRVAKKRRKACRALPISFVVLSVLLYMHFSIYQVAFLHRGSTQKQWVSLDTKLNALKKMGENLGWSEVTEPIYVDNLTWAAAGKNWKSLFEALLAYSVPPPEKSNYVVFQSALFQSIFDYPGFGKRQLTIDERLARISQLLSDKKIDGVLFDPKTEYMFYRPNRGFAERPIQVGYIRCDADVVWFFARKEISNVVRTSEYLRYSPIDRGSYLLLVRGDLLNQGIQVTINEKNSIRSEKFDCGEIYVSSAKAFIIHIKENDADLRVTLSEKNLVQRVFDVSLHFLSNQQI